MKLYVNRFKSTLRHHLLVLLLLTPLSGLSEEFTWAEQQPIGSSFPSFSVKSIDGVATSLEELTGTTGTLLIFNRSTDW